jgi:putative transposase
MQKEIREKIALKRYQLISPVLAEPARSQNEYFRKIAQTEHDFPRYGLRKVRVSTLKAWLRQYRKNGFEGLKPKTVTTAADPDGLTTT